MRIIPKNTKVKMTFYKSVTVADVVIGFIGLVLIAIALSSNLAFKFLIAGGILVLFIPLYITFNEDRVYRLVGYLFRHLFVRKKYKKATKGEVIKNDVEGVVPYERICGGGIISLKDMHYAGIIEVQPVDFRMLNEFSQNELIDGAISKVLNNVPVGYEADIVKVERPLILDNFIGDELERIVRLGESKERGELRKEEYEPRVDLIQDRIALIDEINSSRPIYYSRYYLVLHGGSEKELSANMRYAAITLQSSGINAHILSDKELAAFIRYTIDYDFDERVLDKTKRYGSFFAPSELKFGLTSTQQNGKTLTHFVINNYPLRVANGWGEGLFDMPHTKVVLKAKPVEKFKALRRVDNAILEVQTQNRRNRASDVIEKDTHLESLGLARRDTE